jgi:hypothetical protein
MRWKGFFKVPRLDDLSPGNLSPTLSGGLSSFYATRREPTAIEKVKVVARSNLTVRYDRAGILARRSATD